MTLPSRIRQRLDDRNAWMASDTDLPFEIWAREHAELERNRSQELPRGSAVAWLVLIVLACVVGTLIAIAIGALRGGPQP